MSCYPTAHTACALAFRSACRHSAQAQAEARSRTGSIALAPRSTRARGWMRAGGLALTLALAAGFSGAPESTSEWAFDTASEWPIEWAFEPEAARAPVRADALSGASLS